MKSKLDYAALSPSILVGANTKPPAIETLFNGVELRGSQKKIFTLTRYLQYINVP